MRDGGRDGSLGSPKFKFDKILPVKIRTDFPIEPSVPEVALGWDFFGIPIPKSQIPGIWDFFPPKNPEAKIPKNPKSPGLGFFFEQNPKIPKNPGILFLYLKNNRFSFP